MATFPKQAIALASHRRRVIYKAGGELRSEKICAERAKPRIDKKDTRFNRL
jgi:hypothetical protein